jgi:hypothetical protein
LIDNIMPYSGPASAYGVIGKTDATEITFRHVRTLARCTASGTR